MSKNTDDMSLSDPWICFGPGFQREMVWSGSNGDFELRHTRCLRCGISYQPGQYWWYYERKSPIQKQVCHPCFSTYRDLRRALRGALQPIQFFADLLANLARARELAEIDDIAENILGEQDTDSRSKEMR